MRRHAKAPSAGSTSGCAQVRIAIVLATALALVLAIAPAAQASKGVLGFFGNPTTAPATTGGLFSTPGGTAVNNTTGNVYAVDSGNNRIQEFDSDGNFLRAWGFDVVQPGGAGDGGGQPNVNEQQSVAKFSFGGEVTGGTFALGFEGQTSAPIPYDATSAAVQLELEALSSIGAGNVTVTGAEGGPWAVTFIGTLAQTDVPSLETDGANLTGTGFVLIFASETTKGGTPAAFEICTVAEQCQAGLSSSATAGAMNAPQGLAVDQASGNVYVTDQGFLRVDEFDQNGAFIRSFGQDVVSSGPDDNGSSYEICDVLVNPADVCKEGVGGSEGGALAPPFSGGIAVNPANSDVLVTDPQNARVQEFTAAGGFVRAFGWNVKGSTGFEICTVRAECTAGASGSGVGQFSQPTRIAIGSTGVIYAIDSNLRVQKFTPSGGTLAPAVFAAGVLSGSESNNAPTEIAVDPTNNDVYIVKGNLVGEGTPPAAVIESRVLQLDSSGSLLDTHMTGAAIKEANGFALNPSSGRMYVTSAAGAQRVYVLDNVPAPTVVLGPATEVATNSAKLSGSVNPNGSSSPAGVTASYHFEVKGGTAASWTRYPTAEVDVGAGNAAVPVSITASGLDAHRFYRFRLVATKSFGGPVEISSEGEFNTSQLAPDVFTSPTYEWGPTSGVLKGSVNPNGLPTTYYFEYGTGTGYGTKLPATGNADAGFGASERDFKVSLFHLQPHTTYHYRIVAHNAVGTSTGDDQSFTTGARPMVPDGVDDRAYELVSMRNSNGVAANALEAAVDGDHFVYNGSFLPLPGAENPTDAVEASRTSSGWTQEHISPPVPAGTIVGAENGSLVFVGLGDDHGETALFQTNESLFPGDQNFAPDQIFVSGTDLYERHPDGSFTWVSEPPVLPSTIDPGINYQGRSPDGNHILFTAFGGHLLPQDTHTSNYGLYELDHGALRFVSIQPDGSVLASGAQFGNGGVVDEKGAPTIISADGSRIFFTAGSGASGAGSPQVYVRENHTSTVLASATQRTPPDATRLPAEFAAASTDGSKVFFMSSEQLTNDAKTGAAGTGKDIYEFDVQDGTLRDLSVDINVGDADGARVLGWVGISNDGTHVYYVAESVLAPGATNDKPNLYVYSGGTVKFITTLETPQPAFNIYGHSWVKAAKVSPGAGRYMIFQEAGELVPGEQTGGFEQAWLYDSVSESLKCLSCAPLGGGAPTGPGIPSSVHDPNSGVTVDGRALFSSSDPFVPGDINGTEDVYEYEGGQLHLISGGVSKVDSHLTAGFSANGRDVFFASTDALTPDALAGAEKIYTARTGGGFPLAEDPPEPVLCSGEACQGIPTPPPADATPGTTSVHAPEPVPVPDCTAPKQKLLGAKKMVSHSQGKKKKKARAKVRKAKKELKQCRGGGS